MRLLRLFLWTARSRKELFHLIVTVQLNTSTFELALFAYVSLISPFSWYKQYQNSHCGIFVTQNIYYLYWRSSYKSKFASMRHGSSWSRFDRHRTKMKQKLKEKENKVNKQKIWRLSEVEKMRPNAVGLFSAWRTTTRRVNNNVTDCLVGVRSRFKIQHVLRQQWIISRSQNLNSVLSRKLCGLVKFVLTEQLSVLLLYSTPKAKGHYCQDATEWVQVLYPIW